MSNTTPPIVVPINAHVTNAKEISDEIFNAFQTGLNKVMQSKAFKTGMVKTFQHLGKTIEKAMAGAGKGIANEITKSFAAIPKSAQGAAKGAANAFNHMVPNSAQASVDRLIKHFDRLDKVIAGLGGPNVKLENTLAQLNKSIARTTTETARQQVAAQNSAAQKSAALANASAKQRVAILTAVMGQVRALERGLGSAIKFSLDLATKAARALANAFRRMGESARAGSRQAISAIKSIATALAGVTRAVARMATGLASGFARGFGRISSALTGALRRDEGALRSSLSRRERMVSASASRQGSLLSRAISPQAIAGLAGGAGIGSILSGGFARFANIERLQFQFERLLGSETAAAAMLERISEFARTTSFDLTGVAGLATNFVAMGQSADQTMQSIQSLADVTAFAGGNTESLERIQRALGQIVSTGKLQGDELNQLAENLPGINIRKIIADQLGVSTAELVAMQEAGELDAETFINAFLTGIDDPRFNGAAQEIAKTLSGRLANLKETFDVFGASLVGLVADPLREGMEEVTGILTKVGDFISGEMFKPKAAAENPFADLADDAKVMFEDLPAEWQKQLEALGEGWGPGMWVSGADAKAWWENTNAPEADEALARLEKLREILGDFAKGAGGFLGAAGGLKVFAAALRFLINPLTIATGLFGLLGAAWGRMMKASIPLQVAVDILGDRFGFLLTTLRKTAGLALGLVSKGLFGDKDFFKNMGDKVKGFVSELSKGIGALSGWFVEANKLLELGKVGEVIDSASQSIQGFLSNILGLTDAQLAAAQALGGNDFGNIFTAFLDKLGNVPVLGPITRFIRRIVNAISIAVSGVAGFIGDIWGTLFGGGSDSDISGPGGMFRAMEDRISGGQSESQSIGTRLLNRLEDTFLGPIVRFFRGPFADAIEGVGSFIGGLFGAIFAPEEGAKDDAIITRVADFLSENGLKGLIEYLRGDGLQTAWDNVFNYFAPMVRAVSTGIQKAHDILRPIVKPLTDWIGDIVTAFKEMDFDDFDLGNVVQGAGIGLLAGALVAGPIGGAAGALIGAAFGAGVGDAILNTLDNAWTMQIQPALATLWANIQSEVSKLFTADNLGKAAYFLVDMLIAAGRLVGNIAADPRFVLAIAGIAAAGASAVILFTTGFALGILDNVDEWARLIGGGLEAAWDAVTLKLADLPIIGPITKVIASIVGNPVVATEVALAAFGLSSLIFGALGKKLRAGASGGGRMGGGGISGIATTLATSLFSLIGNTFTTLVRGAGGIVGMMFNGGKATGTGWQGGSTIRQTDGKWTGIGNSIGMAIMGGLAAAVVGYEAGMAGGNTNIVLAMLTGAAGGAALGLQIGGPWGAALGAALGGAATGLGIFFGKAKRQAEEAKQAVDNYVDAILQSGDAGALAALQNAFTTAVVGGDDALGTGLSDIGLTFEQFFADIVTDGMTVGESLGNALTAMDLDIGTDQLEGYYEVLAAIIAKGDDLNPDLLRFAGPAAVELGVDIEDMNTFFDVLKGGGISADELAASLGFLQKQSTALKSGFEITDQLAELAPEAERATEAIMSIDEATQALIEGMQSGWGQAEIGKFLDTSGLGVDDQLRVIEGAADDARTALNNMRTAAIDAFAPITDQSLADALVDLELALQQFQVGDGETAIDIDSAQFKHDADALRDTLAAALAEGMENGSIDSGLEWDRFIEGAKATIRGMNLADDVEAALLGIVDQYAALEPDWAEIYNQERAVAAAEQAAFFAANAWAQKYQATIDSHAYSYEAVFGERGNESGVAVSTPSVSTSVSASDRDAALTMISNMGFSASNITSVVQSAIQDGFKGVNLNGMKNIAGGDDVGRQLGDDVARGVDSTRTKVHSSIRGLTSGISTKGPSSEMFWVGVAMGQGLVNGLNAMLPAVRAAAARLATAAANATKLASGIRSPSTVFRGIGHDIGAGLMLGIEDTEGDMMSAISTAIENAINDATATAQSVAAQAGAAIFEALFPSQMPGGTSYLDIAQQKLALQTSIGGVGAALDSGASESFSNATSGALGDALRTMQGALWTMRVGFADTAADVAEALHHSAEITAWNAAMAKLKKDFASGALGTAAYNEAVAELNTERNAGLITQQQYNDAISDLNKKLKAGILNQEAYNDAIAELGDAPAPLTYEERQAISAGATSLNPSTFVGIANAETINTALEAIANWAQTALESGASVSSVTAQVNTYVAALRAQAAAAGFSTKEIDKLIAAMGLSTAQIAAWAAGLTSLNAATVEGQGNIAMVNEQLQAIRDYGLALLEAGYSASTVRAELIKLRDALIAQLTAFGFNTAQINALVAAAGLSNAALDAFIAQMQAFAQEARNAEAAATAAAEAAAAAAAAERLLADERAAANAMPISRPAVETLNVYIPYGDPEAVGMAAANAIAYQSLTSW